MSILCKTIETTRAGRIALLVTALTSTSCDSGKRDAIRGRWFCSPGYGADSDSLSFSADGTYVHVRKVSASFAQPASYTEWRGDWSIEDGMLRLEGSPVFCARSEEGWVPHTAPDEHLHAEISRLGDGHLELETTYPVLRRCRRMTDWPSRPAIRKEAPSRPAPSGSGPASRKCDCAPTDLACHMRCAVE